jgi:predicted metal-dependent RNase
MKVTVLGAGGGEVTGAAYLVETRSANVHVQLRASIRTMGGLSGHAGQRDLVQRFDSLAPSSPRVTLTHGEDEPRGELRRTIAERHRLAAECPRSAT